MALMAVLVAAKVAHLALLVQELLVREIMVEMVLEMAVAEVAVLVL
jgi:hypothetical protein